jgi:MoaA/NifB/PqqE/SkfB family radical SAM enzyme
VTAPEQALADGILGRRLWLYSNYHCNLVCTYCLTESGPKVARRELDPATMINLAREARELGFTGVGVTGGEPFLVPDMPELLVELSRVLSVLVLTNGTLFQRALFERMAPLSDADVTLQVSLDHPEPEVNDLMRGPENFRKVVEAVPALLQRGIRVRIATTLEEENAEDMTRLCALHRRLGVGDDDHVVRPVIRRGRAETEEMGVWSPFAPTVTRGVLDTDLLLTRTVQPLQRPLDAMLAVVGARPEGADSTLNIR